MSFINNSIHDVENIQIDEEKIIYLNISKNYLDKQKINLQEIYLLLNGLAEHYINNYEVDKHTYCIIARKNSAIALIYLNKMALCEGKFKALHVDNVAYSLKKVLRCVDDLNIKVNAITLKELHELETSLANIQ